MCVCVCVCVCVYAQYIITDHFVNKPHSLWTTKENKTEVFTKGTNSVHPLNAKTYFDITFLMYVIACNIVNWHAHC